MYRLLNLISLYIAVFFFYALIFIREIAYE